MLGANILLKLGPFHIHWVGRGIPDVCFHVVNFHNKESLQSSQEQFNQLLKEEWKVAQQYVQESAVVYELYRDKKK